MNMFQIVDMLADATRGYAIVSTTPGAMGTAKVDAYDRLTRAYVAYRKGRDGWEEQNLALMELVTRMVRFMEGEELDQAEWLTAARKALAAS